MVNDISLRNVSNVSFESVQVCDASISVSSEMFQNDDFSVVSENGDCDNNLIDEKYLVQSTCTFEDDDVHNDDDTSMIVKQVVDNDDDSISFHDDETVDNNVSLYQLGPLIVFRRHVIY